MDVDSRGTFYVLRDVVPIPRQGLRHSAREAPVHRSKKVHVPCRLSAGGRSQARRGAAPWRFIVVIVVLSVVGLDGASADPDAVSAGGAGVYTYAADTRSGAVLTLTNIGGSVVELPHSGPFAIYADGQVVHVSGGNPGPILLRPGETYSVTWYFAEDCHNVTARTPCWGPSPPATYEIVWDYWSEGTLARAAYEFRLELV